MKELHLPNPEWRERYVASMVNTYGLSTVEFYHDGSKNSTGITSTVVPSCWYLGLQTGELTE
jgi:hypothetical protein